MSKTNTAPFLTLVQGRQLALKEARQLALKITPEAILIGRLSALFSMY